MMKCRRLPADCSISHGKGIYVGIQYIQDMAKGVTLTRHQVEENLGVKKTLQEMGDADKHARSDP